MGHTSAFVEHPIGPDIAGRSPIIFHSLVMSEPEHHRGRASTTAVASALLHGALIVAIVVLPLLFYDAIPEQESLRAFFVTPLEIQPPPPPPPPPPAGPRPVARAVPRAPDTELSGFVAPIDVPAEILPEEGIDLGAPGGVPGGVEGGVPGGVVGGVVGGLPQAPPPPPEVKPIRVGGHIQPPRKLKDVIPVYPEIAREARIQGIVIVECTISPRGTVSGVKILRGIPLLNDAALDAVRQWVYTPTLLNGIPVPVIMTVTVTFQLH